jgi:hypothetical protein
MSGMTLWQLDANYVILLNKLEENQGELTPELEQQLNDAVADVVTKQDGYIKVIDTLNTLEEQAKQWRDKMNRKIKSIQNQKERLKDALIYHFHLIGETEIKSELGKIKLMKTLKVGEMDIDALPEKYKELVEEIKVNKKQLLADLKQGPINGAELEESEYIRIF